MGNRRAKDIIKILLENDFMEVSQKGSHKKLKKGSIVVIVPDHGGKDLGTGLIRKFEKQTGIKLLNPVSDK